MALRISKFIKNPWTEHWKWVDFSIYKLYLTVILKNKIRIMATLWGLLLIVGRKWERSRCQQYFFLSWMLTAQVYFVCKIFKLYICSMCMLLSVIILQYICWSSKNMYTIKILLKGTLWWAQLVKRLPFAQVTILESWDGVQHRLLAQREPDSPSAYSACSSLCFCSLSDK